MILMARRIEEPRPLGAPETYVLKVRADHAGNAAFTFDTRISPDDEGNGRSPFGVIFYRTHHEEVIRALYEPATAAAILHAGEPFSAQQFLDLVNLQQLPEQLGFPVPDRPGIQVPGDTDTLRLQRYQAVIRSTLMPLTEQVPMLSFIRAGYRTENLQPSIRDINGNFLSQDSDEFNAFPMIRKFTKPADPGALYLRITDYTLKDASRFLYFYNSAEVTMQLVPGPLSPFAGPVIVMQTRPAPAPQLSSGVPGVSPDNETGISVTFNISPFAAGEQINRVRLSRSANRALLENAPWEAALLETAWPSQNAAGLEVIDPLTDVDREMLGSTLYYRVAGVRTIWNEKDEEEDILSAWSDIRSVRLLDQQNPVAPVLEYESSSQTLSWTGTASQAEYYLFRQNNRGNWSRVIGPLAGGIEGFSYRLPEALPQTDSEGNPLYHRFRVNVVNSSGLMNLSDRELTIDPNNI